MVTLSIKQRFHPTFEQDRQTIRQLGSNSANLYDSGPVVGLFIISRQHTWAWNIGLLRHWALAAGKKQGVRRCRRNANECPPLLQEISFATLAQRCPEKQLYPGLRFDSNVKGN